jgi:hypothetical protein
MPTTHLPIHPIVATAPLTLPTTTMTRVVIDPTTYY